MINIPNHPNSTGQAFGPSQVDETQAARGARREHAHRPVTDEPQSDVQRINNLATGESLPSRTNKLGIWGWIGGGRWGLERYLYTLHRITGLGLLAYFLIHIWVTSIRVFGYQAWTRTMSLFSKPMFMIGEFLVFTAFAFHGINGLRLICVELGIGIGQPIEPIYPYKTSVHRQRPLAIMVMVIAGLLAALGGINYLWI